MVELVRLPVKDLFLDGAPASWRLDPALLRRSLGDAQVSFVVVSVTDPMLVLAGGEALVAAASKGARYVWAVVFRSQADHEPAAARDPDLLAQIPWQDLLWV